MLLEKARALPAPVFVIDVRSSTGSYDKSVGRMRACLIVSAVMRLPGEDDSRYRSAILDHVIAEDPIAMRAAIDEAHAVAVELGASFHPAPAEVPPPGTHQPSWIERQDSPPSRAWIVTWTTTRWRDDGIQVHADGEISVDATRGSEARYAAERRLFASIAPPYERTLTLAELDAYPRQGMHEAGYPSDAPTAESLRALAAAGQSIAVIIDTLIAVTPLERMIAFAQAFYLDIKTLAPIAEYARGTLDGDALDVALAPSVKRMQPRWSVVAALRAAHAKGNSLAPVLRAHYGEVAGAIALMIAFREAFELGLPAAKMVVSCACDGTSDRLVDQYFAEALDEKAHA